MKHIILISSFLILVVQSFGQTTKNELVERFDAAKSFIYNNPDTAIQLFEEIRKEAVKLKQDSIELHAMRLLGVSKDVAGDYEGALITYNDAQRLAENQADSFMLGSLAMLKGIVYHRLADYSKAVDYYAIAQPIFRAINRKEQLAALLNNMAVVYKVMDLYEQALEIHAEALELAIEANDSARMASIFANSAAIYYQQGKIDTCEILIRKSIEIDQKSNKESQIAPDYQSLGAIFSARNNSDSAIYYFNRAIRLYRKYNKTDDLADVYTQLAEQYLQDGEIAAAKEYVDSALFYLESQPRLEVADNTYELAKQVYSSLGQFEESLKYAQLKNDWLEMRNAEKLQSRLISMDLEEKVRKYKLDLDQGEVERQSLLANSQRQLFYILILGVFVGMLALMMVFNIRNQRIKNNLLNQLANQNKDLHELISTQTKTLSVVGHDLRSPIASLVNMFKVIQVQDGLSENERKEMLNYGVKSLESTLLNLDGLMFWAGNRLSNMDIGRENVVLLPIIQQTLELYKLMINAKELNVSLDCDESIVAFVNEGDLGVIVRNLLNNAIKFTHDQGEISIKCFHLGKSACLTINDNGMGMSAEQLERINNRTVESTSGTKGELGSGIGLKALFDSIEKNNARVTFDSEVGKGTSVKVCFPVGKK